MKITRKSWEAWKSFKSALVISSLRGGHTSLCSFCLFIFSYIETSMPHWYWRIRLVLLLTLHWLKQIPVHVPQNMPWPTILLMLYIMSYVTRIPGSLISRRKKSQLYSSYICLDPYEIGPTQLFSTHKKTNAKRKYFWFNLICV